MGEKTSAAGFAAAIFFFWLTVMVVGEWLIHGRFILYALILVLASTTPIQRDPLVVTQYDDLYLGEVAWMHGSGGWCFKTWISRQERCIE